jgi:CBS domain containing-hemolysin-like protein
MKLVYVLLALGFFKCIVLYKVYHSVPALELKRRARMGDTRAAKLHKVSSYGPAQEVLLWLVGTTTGAILLIWSARTSWWLAAGIVVIAAWLVVWMRFPADGWAGKYAAMFSAPHSWILGILQPVLGRVASWLPPGRESHNHTKLYEKKDWLELLKRQNQQEDNRVPQGDLNIAANAMTFGDKTVGSVMTPRREVKFAKADDQVTPIVIDELHKSGFSRFPVVKDSSKSTNPQIVGTLYLNSLIDYSGSGKVKDLMRAEVYFINEDSVLRQALSAFLKTHHHLLIVVNSFEELVGVLSLEDVLEQILGKEIVDEFDSYENLRAVAAMNAQKELAEHQEVKPEQTTETVVK